MYEEEIQEVVAELEKELELWKEMFGRVPGEVVQMDTFVTANFVDALIAVLVEKELITEEELSLASKKKLLESMRFHRQQATEVRRSALIESIVPKMTIPKNIRGKNHG